MTCVVGLDGSASAGHALTQAKRLARLIGHTNLRERLFGSVPKKLLAAAKLPLTIVP